MKNILLLFFTVLLIVSCKSKETIGTIKSNDDYKGLIINAPLKVKLNEEIKFEIINNGSDTITLLNPMAKTIEKFENNSWILQRLLYCPCGAQCQPSIPRMELLENQKIELEWNLNEAWCVKNSSGIMETEIKKVDTGLFRIKIRFEKEKYNTEVLYKEFKVVN